MRNELLSKFVICILYFNIQVKCNCYSVSNEIHSTDYSLRCNTLFKAVYTKSTLPDSPNLWW